MQPILLHITDCHLVPTGQQLLQTDTHETLSAVLAQALGEARPDAIVATGDLVHSGGAEVYRRFLSTVESYCDAPLLYDAKSDSIATGAPTWAADWLTD